MSFLKYIDFSRTWRQKIAKRGLIFVLLISTFFLAVPQKSYAFLGVGDISFDPPQEVEGVLTTGATGATAITTGLSTGFNAAQWAKTYVLDGVATAVARQIIRKLTAQTVNWINSGFKGNPAYVTDPEKFFLNVGDNIASQFIQNHPALNNLCTPFKAQVRLALVKNYLNDNNNYSCTIDKIVKNYEAFTRDFDQGGWDGWFAMTQNNSNNAYGAYLDAQAQLSAQIANKQALKNTELNQGRGFLSFKKCDAWAEPNSITKGQAKLDALAHASDANSESNLRQQNIAQFQLNLDKARATYAGLFNDKNTPPAQLAAASAARQEAQNQLDAYIAAHPDTSQTDALNSDNDLDIAANNSDETSVGDVNPAGKVCTSVSTVTPGSAIESQLEKVLGSSVSQLELTNSINQVVSALMTQMVEQVVGGIGSGLRGLSQKDSSQSDSRTFLERMIPPIDPNAPREEPPKDAGEEDKKIGDSIDKISGDAFPTASSTDPHILTKEQAEQQAEQDRNGATQSTIRDYCTLHSSEPNCIQGTPIQ